MPPLRVRHQQHRDLQQGNGDKDEHGSFPATEAAACHDRDQCDRRDRHHNVFRDADVLGGQADADELGDDRQEIKQEQVADGKPAPATAEAFVDQPGVPDPGDRAEPDHHLLVDDEHRDQQQQHPQQRVAVVLAGLGVGGHPARVVVADHHDDPGTDDGQQGQQPRLQRAGISVSPTLIRPNAPSMSPRCAVSSTALRCGAASWVGPAGGGPGLVVSSALEVTESHLPARAR